MDRQSAQGADSARALLDRLRARLWPGLTLLGAPASDRRDSLFPAEHERIERAVPTRKHEYSTGRWLARLALSAIDHPPVPILGGPANEPLWPAGVVGSLTHSAAFCAVAIGRATDYRGIGLDLELSRPPSSDIAHLIVAASEPPEYRTEPWLRLVFSAKEAVFKCVYPLAKRFIDFHEVAVALDEDSRSFAAIACSREAAESGVELGVGMFETDGIGAASVFVIPSTASSAMRITTR